MLATIRAMFARKPAAPAIRPAFDDIPAHKGFRVVYRFNGHTMAENIAATLDQARAIARARRDDGRLYGGKPRLHVYIQNLETGRLCA